MVDGHLRRNKIWEVTTKQGDDGVHEHLQQSEECSKAMEEWHVGLDFGPFNSPMHGSGMATLPCKFFFTMWVVSYSSNNSSVSKMISIILTYPKSR